MERMNNLYDKNQKAYWQAVKDMSDFCRSNDGNPISVDAWIEHFTNLMSDTNIGPNNDEVLRCRTYKNIWKICARECKQKEWVLISIRKGYYNII